MLKKFFMFKDFDAGYRRILAAPFIKYFFENIFND